MGFFSGLKAAAAEANEDAHSTRLLNETKSTLEMFRRMDENLLAHILVGYMQIRQKLEREMGNWSRDGRIKVGREMQSQARASFDFDQRGSYAKWIAGAWLESKERNNPKAQQAYLLMEGLAAGIESARTPPHSGSTHGSWDQWLLAFKQAAARENAQLRIEANGKSRIDFMDQEPLRRAFQDNVDPSALGRDFARQFDARTFGR